MAHAEPTQWRLALGAEIGSSSFGLGDVGVRRGAFSFELLTDTIDLRWAPQIPDGRAWIAARAEVLAAGLLLAPWTDGRPDLARSLLASYVGGDGGWIRHLPHGLYLGAQGSVRQYFFNARPETRVPVPPPTLLGTVEVVLGRWTPSLHVWIRAGFDAQERGGRGVSPHVALEAIYHPTGVVAPRLELRAGFAENQTDLTLTRLGGLNPYVVPVAGAGWAEWWVEDYVAARLGLTWQHRWLEVGLTVDAAVFPGHVVSGFSLSARVHVKRYFVETALGWAPWIERQPGVSPVTLWLRLGLDWGPEGTRN